MEEITKKCCACQGIKNVSEFGADRQKSDGLTSLCKKCKAKKAMESYHRNAHKNQQKWNEQAKARYRANPSYREAQKLRMRRKRQTDPIFRLNCNFSSSISRSVRGGKGWEHWENVVGYTLEQLKTHLEGKFSPGMTWENYGEWHIDHVKPLAKFEMKSVSDAEFRKCWSLTNLQPLWAGDNIRKADKF